MDRGMCLVGLSHGFHMVSWTKPFSYVVSRWSDDPFKQDQSPLAARNLTLQLRVLDASGQLLFQGRRVSWSELERRGRLVRPALHGSEPGSEERLRASVRDRTDRFCRATRRSHGKRLAKRHTSTEHLEGERTLNGGPILAGVASVQENWRSDGVRKLEDVLKDIEPLGARQVS